MDLGGPVWHASAAPGAAYGRPGRAMLEAECVRQLNGVGDPALGEWREWTGTAFHLRRRLTLREARAVGPVVDVRGTPEAARRIRALGPMLAYVDAETLAAELGGQPL